MSRDRISSRCTCFFDEVHGVAIEWADLCAERLVALGGTADGRIQNVAEKTELTPYPLATKDGMDPRTSTCFHACGIRT